MSLPARNASAELSASEERIPEAPTSLDLPQFLAMLECRGDATRRVAALESLNHSVFEAPGMRLQRSSARSSRCSTTLFGMSSELQSDGARPTIWPRDSGDAELTALSP